MWTHKYMSFSFAVCMCIRVSRFPFWSCYPLSSTFSALTLDFYCNRWCDVVFFAAAAAYHYYTSSFSTFLYIYIILAFGATFYSTHTHLDTYTFKHVLHYTIQLQRIDFPIQLKSVFAAVSTHTSQYIHSPVQRSYFTIHKIKIVHIDISKEL